MQHHDDVELMAGDDWVISGRLLDRDGSPFNLDNALLNWTLINPDGWAVTLTQDVTLNVTNSANGLISIVLPSSFTRTIAPGRYTDALRVVVGGFTETFWTGYIQVDADPFAMELIPDDNS